MHIGDGFWPVLDALLDPGAYEHIERWMWEDGEAFYDALTPQIDRLLDGQGLEGWAAALSQLVQW